MEELERISGHFLTGNQSFTHTPFPSHLMFSTFLQIDQILQTLPIHTMLLKQVLEHRIVYLGVVLAQVQQPPHRPLLLTHLIHLLLQSST